MDASWIKQTHVSLSSVLDFTQADLLVAEMLSAAAQGHVDAYFSLGIAFSTEGHAVGTDLVEAHKWFNLAAVAGHGEAPTCRAEVADDMTAREIAEAQRRARQWLAVSSRGASHGATPNREAA